jgi:6-phosphogluconolactonase
MKKLSLSHVAIATIAILLTQSCSKDVSVIAPNSGGTVSEKLDDDGYVYTQSNAPEVNGILIYAQHPDGSLTFDGSVASGGAGTGIELGNQGALVLNEDHTMLFAVNAGDNTVSSFSVDAEGGLQLLATAATGGILPVSVTYHQPFLFVVNARSCNISGFMVGADGSMALIPNSMNPLSGDKVEPAQIGFSPDGNTLIVTEKASNKITSFKVDSAGGTTAPISVQAVGRTPFGFQFKRDNNFIVSNASGGIPTQATATSYYINNDGSINLNADGPEPNHQTASCWVALGFKNGKYAYVTNTGSNTISSYSIDNTGSFEVKEQVAATTEGEPIDVVVSGGDQKFLYVINAATHTIGGYVRNNDGTLTFLSTIGDLPASATGLVAYK